MIAQCHTTDVIPNNRHEITSCAKRRDVLCNVCSATQRESPAATVLANGRVLVCGGSGPAGVATSAEIYDPGLVFATSSQPVIDTAPDSILLGETLTLTGQRFFGVSESSGGNGGQNSASNRPIVQLRALEGGQTAILQPGTNGSDTSFTSTAISGFPLGYALVSLSVNGIPSVPKIVNLTVTDPAPYDVWKATYFSAAELGDAATSGDLADPDLDGTANLMEYLQALNPRLSDTHLLPTIDCQGTYPKFTYRLNKLATDVSYSVESSSTLAPGSWQAVAVTYDQVDYGTYLLITAKDFAPIATTPRRFMRLRVSRP